MRRHRVMDRPVPGHFAVRTAPRMPWVPAVIFAPCPAVLPDEMDWPYRPEWWFENLDRSAYPLAAKVGERVFESQDAVFRVWTWGREITPQAYAYLMARREWARRWAPSSFEAKTRHDWRSARW